MTDPVRAVFAAVTLVLTASLVGPAASADPTTAPLWQERYDLVDDADAALRRVEVVAAMFPAAADDAERTVADTFSQRFADLDATIADTYIAEAAAAGYEALPDDAEPEGRYSPDGPADTGGSQAGHADDPVVDGQGAAGEDGPVRVDIPGGAETVAAAPQLPDLEELPSISTGPVGAGGVSLTPLGLMACPVTASLMSHVNDWHFPRSGGRVHMGNDVFAPEGSPVYAPQAGTVEYVQRSNSGLGGLSLAINTDEGGRWYLAHHAGFPDGIVAGLRVEVGQLVAYVGRTGNAASTPPHVHAEYRLPNGTRINPYFGIAAACTNQPLAPQIVTISGGNQPGAPPTEENFLLLASCESGTRGVIGSHNPQALSPTGKYMGAFQFDQPTWESVGGSRTPLDWPFEEQLNRARILQSRRGWQPWPQCAPALGLL